MENTFFFLKDGDNISLREESYLLFRKTVYNLSSFKKLDFGCFFIVLHIWHNGSIF